MSSSIEQRQKFIRYWKETTGETEVDMKRVSKLALEMGWKPPPTQTAEERMEKLFKTAAKGDIRHDEKTGRPYHGYHAYPKMLADGQFVFSYIDIDDPKTRPQNFKKACVMRREQSVDDLFALFLDQTHWNETRSAEQQVEMLPADLDFDIQLRLAAMDKKPKAA
jgi:hypothetical protein